MVVRLILLLVSVGFMLISGCGSVSENGSTSLFERASVSFTATTVNISSTVIPKPNVDDSASAATIVIVVTPYPGALGAAAFTVRNLRYAYTPKTGSNLSFTINGPNYSTNLTFSPVLASGEVKDFLVDQGFDPLGTQSWIYDVQAMYTVVEDTSGKTKDYSVPLGSIRFTKA